MKITGFKIQQKLRELEHQREICATQFSEGLFTFAGDAPQTDMRVLGKRYVETETHIAQLQALQATYNLALEVSVAGRKLSLHEAVKRVGGAGRYEKMWRLASKSTGRGPYQERSTTRRTDEVHAVRTVTIDTCISEAREAAKFAGELRAAIATANTTELTVSDEFEKLFA